MSDESPDPISCLFGLAILIFFGGLAVACVVCSAGFAWWLVRHAWGMWA